MKIKIPFIAVMLFCSCNENSVTDRIEEIPNEQIAEKVNEKYEKLDSFYVKKIEYHKSLFLFSKEQEYNLYSYKRGDYLTVDEIKDYDNNGFPDALVHKNLGGTCCPDNYYFLALNYGNGYVKLTDEFHTGYYNNTEELDGQFYIIADNDYEGSVRSKYIVEDGKVIEAEKFSVGQISSIIELDVSDFDDAYQSKQFFYDIDNDGTQDTVTAWTNYQFNLNMSVFLTSTNSVTKFKNCCPWYKNRIGVLKSDTKGYHDLVVNNDILLKWNGLQYENQIFDRYDEKYK